MERIGHNPVTPVIAAALAAVGAAVLIGFALLAQVTARGPSAPGTDVRSPGSSRAIVLPSLRPEAIAAGLNETGRSIVDTVVAAIPSPVFSFAPDEDVALASADDALPPLSVGDATDGFEPAPSRPSEGSDDEVATRPATGAKKAKKAGGINDTRARSTNEDGREGQRFGSRSAVKGSSGPSSAGVKATGHGTKHQANGPVGKSKAHGKEHQTKGAVGKSKAHGKEHQAKGPVGKSKAHGKEHQAKGHQAKSKSRRAAACRR